MKPFPLADAKTPSNQHCPVQNMVDKCTALLAQSLPSFVLVLMFEAEIYATGCYAQCFFEARFQQMK
jgi:hypothetical protein